jgi:hypothetical protein
VLPLSGCWILTVNWRHGGARHLSTVATTTWARWPRTRPKKTRYMIRTARPSIRVSSGHAYRHSSCMNSLMIRPYCCCCFPRKDKVWRIYEIKNINKKRWKILQSDELHILYFPINNVVLSNQGLNGRNTYHAWADNDSEQHFSQKTWRKTLVNIKTEGRDWVNLAEARPRLRTLVDTVLMCLFPTNVGNFLVS